MKRFSRPLYHTTFELQPKAIADLEQCLTELVILILSMLGQLKLFNPWTCPSPLRHLGHPSGNERIACAKAIHTAGALGTRLL